MMPNYMIAYVGQPKQPATPEEGQAHMEKWKAWLAGLGEAVINPGSPLGASKLVTSDGTKDDDGSFAMMGFSVVSADSLDAAVAMAEACPYVEIGGTLKVAELKSMKM